MPTFRAIALCATIALAACAEQQPAHDHPIHRIISLVPSITEDLYDIGAGDTVVGLPVISAGDTVVAHEVARLRPDIVVGDQSQGALAAAMHKAGVPTMLLADTSFDDIFRTVDALGVLTGRTRNAHAFAARLQARTVTLLKTVRPKTVRPRVAVLLSVAPVVVASSDQIAAKLIELAGGQLTSDLIAADVIVMDPAVQLQTALTQAPLKSIRAVRANHFFAFPDPAIFERPGPRYNDGLAWLIQRLNALPE